MPALAPAAEARAMLADQQTRLMAVIAMDAFSCTTRLASHYLAKVRAWQREPDSYVDRALGEMGANGLGAAIDDVCKDAAFHARANRMLATERRAAA